MKTLAEIQAAVDEIKAVCDKHGVVLIGTCDWEGIYGEIAITDNYLCQTNWRDAYLRVDNKIYQSENQFEVNGIGSVKA